MSYFVLRVWEFTYSNLLELIQFFNIARRYSIIHYLTRCFAEAYIFKQKTLQ